MRGAVIAQDDLGRGVPPAPRPPARLHGMHSCNSQPPLMPLVEERVPGGTAAEAEPFM